MSAAVPYGMPSPAVAAIGAGQRRRPAPRRATGTPERRDRHAQPGHLGQAKTATGASAAESEPVPAPPVGR
ncbi:UNVERIFIED_CONTAM: hypothetical protein RKD50_000615 [Streptomyces canus]